MPYDARNKRIVFDEWKTGIAESSAEGIADMRGMDPLRKPGYLELSEEMINEADVPFTYTITVNTVTDVVTSSGSIVRASTGDGSSRAVRFTTSNTLPAPLVAGTTYYITGSAPSNTTFKLSSTIALAGAGTSDIDFTTTGTGTQTMVSYNMGTPTYIVNAPYYNYKYLQCSNGDIWQKTSNYWLLLAGNTLTNASGNGIVVWKNYLLVFRDTIIDYYDIVNSLWTNGWKTGITTSPNHLPFYSANDNVYFNAAGTFGGKQYVGSIVENTNQVFDPANSATYTYSTTALDIPEAITCFEDLKPNLMIGTENNKIRVWDGTAPSFTTINIVEPYVQCMKTLGNILYFSSGSKANIYRTYGTTVEKFIDLSDELAQSLQYAAMVKAMSFNSNEILFWVTGTSQSISGIYAADLVSRAYHMKYIPSKGNAVSINGGALYVLGAATNNDVITVGYITGGVTYIDSNYAFGTTSSMVTRYAAYVNSPMYEVADFEEPFTFQKMQINLTKPLTSGQGITIASRKSLADAFANTVTFDTSSDMGTTLVSGEGQVNIEKAQFIQFQISMRSSASAPVVDTTVFTTPTLKSLIVY